MAASDAKPVPQKGVAYRATFPLIDADGDLVSGAASLDSEVSIDGAAFADCTNEATEIATSSGIYYLDLTAAEMNGDTVAVIVKTGTAGAKTTVLVFYPEEAGDIRVNVTQVAGTTQTAGDIIGDTNDIQSRLPAALVSGRIDASVGAMAANVVTAAAVANGAIDAATFAAGAIDAAAIADGAIDAATFAAGAINAAAIAADAITAAKIATGAIDADAIAADAVTEIQSGLSTLDAAGVRTAVGLAAANLDTQLSAIDDFLDTEVAAIKAKTDSLTFTVAGVVDANIQRINDVTITGNGQVGTEFGV